MSLAARQGAAHVQLPLGQLALVGLGAFCIANPDKFFSTLAHGAAFLQNSEGPRSQGGASSQPIIIHQSVPAAAGSSAKGIAIRLVVGASLCWGSYVVLVTVLPEQAKQLLPVNKAVFNQAVTSLGKAVLNLKDTLLEQMHALSGKQDELSDKQDKTHTEVVEIKENVQDVKGDISAVQEALDLCQASLSDAERRTTYITRGVQLLTRGVSTILPEDEHLLTELAKYNLAGEEFRGPAPLQRERRLREHRDNLRRLEVEHQSPSRDTPQAEIVIRPSSGISVNSLESPYAEAYQVQSNQSSDPENDHPAKIVSPAAVEASVADIHTLLRMHGNPAAIQTPLNNNVHSVMRPRRSHV